MNVVLGGVVLALVLALATVQLGSDAVFARAGQQPSLPASLSRTLGIAIYRAIARVAPAPYVDDMLARAELERGELAQAQRYADRLPPSVPRAELLARIAQAQGDAAAAQRYFLAAGDVEAIDFTVSALARHDLVAAYHLETQLKDRLERSGTHPDFVADAYWRLGELATRRSWALQAQIPRQLWVSRAFAAYRTAAALSPLSGKYLLSAGFAAYGLHEYTRAQRYFEGMIDLNPASANGYVGAGLVALQNGDRATAQRDAGIAERLDARAHALRALEALIR